MTDPVHERLAQDLYDLFLARPEQNKRQLLASLQSKGRTGLTGTAINSILYEVGRPFLHDDATPPRWRIVGPPKGATAPASSDPPAARNLPGYKGPDPRAWQWEAFDAWRAAGHCGVVEAVTGSGKTCVGVMAAAEAVANGGRVLIVVPGLDLLDQWYKQLIRELPAVSVGRFGDGYDGDLVQYQVLVSTVQSACKWRMLEPGQRGLLIADEVHRYGAETYSLALEDAFEERLGLTATYEREDNGVADHLTPYFSNGPTPGTAGGEIVARCGYERGLADAILSPFRVGLVGVSFTAPEQADYDQWDGEAGRARTALVNQYGCPDEPFGVFMQAVAKLSDGGNDDSKATHCARRYLNAFTKRRALMADCGRKLEALGLLSPVLSQAERALVFTETVHSANRAAATLSALGISAKEYTSELDQRTRKERLQQFRAGTVRVLAAPRVLDEGIDVPEADVGVIVAASRSRRQMIQRMGRIIRPKRDGRPATFLILYVRDTFEDPALGANGAFLDEIVDLADKVQLFPAGVSGRELLAWHEAL